MKKTYLVPEYQRRRYLVYLTVEAGSRQEALGKILDGKGVKTGEQLLSTTHGRIPQDEIVALSQIEEGR